MTDPVQSAYDEMLAGHYQEGGLQTEAAINKLIAAHAARPATAEQALRVGSVRIDRPAPEPVMPEPLPEPAVELGQEFLPYAADIEQAQAAAQRHGFGMIHGVLAMLAGLGPHEVTPATATPEERLSRADAAVDVLIQKHGEDRASELTAAWREAVARLGLGRLTAARGADTNHEVVEFVATHWLSRPGAV